MDLFASYLMLQRFPLARCSRKAFGISVESRLPCNENCGPFKAPDSSVAFALHIQDFLEESDSIITLFDMPACCSFPAELLLLDGTYMTTLVNSSSSSMKG
jgi:hypothetical protein